MKCLEKHFLLFKNFFIMSTPSFSQVFLLDSPAQKKYSFPTVVDHQLLCCVLQKIDKRRYGVCTLWRFGFKPSVATLNIEVGVDERWLVFEKFFQECLRIVARRPPWRYHEYGCCSCVILLLGLLVLLEWFVGDLVCRLTYQRGRRYTPPVQPLFAPSFALT